MSITYRRSVLKYDRLVDSSGLRESAVQSIYYNILDRTRSQSRKVNEIALTYTHTQNKMWMPQGKRKALAKLH